MTKNLFQIVGLALFLLLLPKGLLAVTWFASPSGSGTTCSVGSPCTPVQGYLNASSGDTIQLACGTYGGQTFTANSHSPVSVIKMVPATATPGCVSMGQVDMNGATWLEIAGSTWTGQSWGAGACHSTATCNIQISEWDVELTTSPITANNTLSNVNINGGIFYVGGNSNTIRGGGIGPGNDFHPQLAPVAGYLGQALNWLFDGVYFHDWTRDSSAIHVECLQIAGSTNLIIRNSKFQRCSVFDLSFTSFNGSGDNINITLENDSFAATNVDTCSSCGQGFFTINLSCLTGGLIHFISSAQGAVVQTCGGGAPANSGTLTITGNNMDGGILDGNSGVCVGSSMTATYKFNVMKQGPGRCDVTDSLNTASNGFVNESGFDLSLSAGAPAIDFVSLAQSFPSTDINGTSRPDGSANDAGAFQFGAGSAVTTPSSFMLMGVGQ